MTHPSQPDDLNTSEGAPPAFEPFLVTPRLQTSDPDGNLQGQYNEGMVALADRELTPSAAQVNGEAKG